MAELIRGVLQRPLRVLVYGPEGIGKTSFAACFPEPVYIDTEGSTERFDVARFPRPASWVQLQTLVKQVRDDPKLCRTLVLDTADWAEILCRQHVCSSANKKGIEDFGYGKGYIYAAEEYGRLLDLLSEVYDTGRHIVVTAHAAMRKFEQPDEMGSYDRWELKMDKRIAALLKEWADIILFANYETVVVKSSDGGKAKAQGGKRVMYTTHHPCWDAKNRFGLPEKLPFGFEGIAHLLYPTELAPGVTSEQAVQLPMPAVMPGERIEIPDGIPDAQRKALEALDQLYTPRGIRPDEIQHAVHQRGYFPESVPIDAYPTDFINGVLIAAFEQVAAMIENDPDRVPF